MKLGVCYYPEHWPESDWPEDARQMRAMGIGLVRIAEFAWSRIEPEPGTYDWGWLDRAIATLAAEGLEVILCTPTATPPKWLVDREPSILPVGADGQPKRFGSRRHYCFSSSVYLAESDRIVTAMAARYGGNQAIVMWQTDNEYGHHGTHESYSPEAVQAFREWLRGRYGGVDRLNEAWGTKFWSQTYRSFDEIDAPIQTVTEATPAHRLDYRRFSSEAIAAFNLRQVEIIRRYSPGRPVTHNFIGDFTGFDAHGVGRDLDIASWDSYPLGFLDESDASETDKTRWLHQGHPDFAAFNHDLYAAVSAQWGVMEQQPGPVNWAPHNPAPAPGMVRLWAWEAFAHGAAFVSFFRWRRLPVAQEQMHAGLLEPNRARARVCDEVEQLADELEGFGRAQRRKADVAMIVDADSFWHAEIQPQAQPKPFEPARALYSALRQLGLDIDLLPQSANLDGYRLVVLPSVRILSHGFCSRLEDSGAQLLATAMTGSRDESGALPHDGAPGLLGQLAGLRVEVFESLPPFVSVSVAVGKRAYTAHRWREQVVTVAETRASFADGSPAWVQNGRCHYLACWPGDALLQRVLEDIVREAGLAIRKTGRDLRLRRAGSLQFAFNYGPDHVDLRSVGAPTSQDGYRLGGPRLSPFDVAAWEA